jgi:TonB family protein
MIHRAVFGASRSTNPFKTRWFGSLALLLALAIPAYAANDRAVKSRVAPIYPEIAKRMKISGEVKLDVTISPEGKVKDAKAVSGNHMLGTAAEDAVRKWIYEPAASDTSAVVVVNFSLAQ